MEPRSSLPWAKEAKSQMKNPSQSFPHYPPQFEEGKELDSVPEDGEKEKKMSPRVEKMPYLPVN